MKASKFSDAQKAFILKQGADGIPVADICRKAGISQATCFGWKKRCDGLLPTEMRRLKLLEDAAANASCFGESAKLRKLVADLALDRDMLQDVIRRKLEGLLASARWATGCAWTGECRSGVRAGFLRATRPPTTASPVGTTSWQPERSSGSSRSSTPPHGSRRSLISRSCAAPTIPSWALSTRPMQGGC